VVLILTSSLVILIVGVPMRFKYLLILLFIGSAQAEDSDQFLTEWQALIHAGVMSCDFHIDKASAIREGDRIFIDYFDRRPTVVERILAAERTNEMAVRNYAKGVITCDLVANTLSEHLY